MAKRKPITFTEDGIVKISPTDQLDGKLNVSGPNVVLARLTSGEGGHEEISPASLTEETTPAAGDFLLGWESGGALRKFDIGDLPSGGGGGVSSIYKALVTQSGTSDPTAVVLQNDLGGTVVWTRAAEGSYRATLAGAFPANKVFFLATDVSDGGGGNYGVPPIVRLDDDTMIIETPNGDGYLVATPIMFEVFP